MAEPNPNSTPAPTSAPSGKSEGRRSIKRIFVSRLQHGWLTAMGVEVPWIAANESGVDRGQRSTTPNVPSDAAPAQVSTPLVEPPTVQPVQQTMPQPQRVPDRTLAAAPAAPASKLVESVPELDVSLLGLAQIGQAVSACQRCGLCETRQHAVPGDGVDRPTILIVGEAPGEQEDQQGKPFVGRSGQLLDNMLKAIGHGRDTSVFITNVVKCRPPANRNPRDEEIAACAPYLARQIELLAPTAILAMGRFAAHALLKTDASLQTLRGSTHTLDIGGQSMPVVVTYHPAYLLRRPVDKRLAWEDLKRLRGLVS